MKYCPTCETRFDEEIMRFCTKDGTPLINEEEPKFIEMPSESLENEVEDDADDVTVVRRNIPVPPPSLDQDMSFEPSEKPGQRIVVPTMPEPREQYQRARPRAYYPPPKPNTFKVVVLTIVGTVFVLGFAGLLILFLQKDRTTNTNLNLNANLTNINTNLNTNIGIDTNFNFNTGSNFNVSGNVNTNANLKTPTPTPKPSPSPSPSASPTPTPDDLVIPATPRPSPSPTQRPPISPTPSPRVTPRVLITPSNRPN